jgi:hypothetical protein
MLAPLTFAVALATASVAHAVEPGYVDFGRVARSEKGQCVDITLGSGVLKLASFFVKHEEPEAAAMLRSISKVRVNVIGLDDSNRSAATERMTAVRSDLVRQGWEQIVTVQGKRDEDVAIFLKQRDGEIVEGIVVTVMDERKNEAVFINVVGNIKAEQLGELGGRLHIDRLSNVHGLRKL